MNNVPTEPTTAFTPHLHTWNSTVICSQEQASSPQSSNHQKLCTSCFTPRSVLVRCRIDSTQKWHFVCPGTCWKKASGGVQDGVQDKPFYQYGGMWKDKHEAVSAKMKPRDKKKSWKKKQDIRNEVGRESLEKTVKEQEVEDRSMPWNTGM